MGALCNSLTRRYPATLKITDCTQLPQQTKKTSQQNPFAHHQRLVKVSDGLMLSVGKTKSVYISLIII